MIDGDIELVLIAVIISLACLVGIRYLIPMYEETRKSKYSSWGSFLVFIAGLAYISIFVSIIDLNSNYHRVVIECYDLGGCNTNAEDINIIKKHKIKLYTIALDAASK